MPTQVLMPALSPTMEEGTLAKWLVSEGQEVKAGDVIAEIETDKATMEVEAVDEGRLQKILVPAGTEGVKVNTPIALIAGENDAPSPAKAEYAGAKAAAAVPPGGEGSGVGGAPSAAVLRYPPPQPSPTRGEGVGPPPTSKGLSSLGLGEEDAIPAAAVARADAAVAREPEIAPGTEMVTLSVREALRDAMAAPTPMPAKPCSVMGVSITRLSPNSSSSPWLIL